MEPTIESLRPGDDERRWALARLAFGATDSYDPQVPAPAADRVVAAYDGDRLVGAVVTLDFGQFWGSAPVPCGGLSGVVVAPEARGRGLVRAMVSEALGRMRSRGEVLSALYPTTATLYRSMGWEVAGWYRRRAIPLSAVPTEPATVLTWRLVGFDDPALEQVYLAMAPTHDGWLRHDPTSLTRIQHRRARDTSTNRFAYVGSRDGEDVAAVVYRYGASQTAMYDLETELVAGVDGAAVAAVLAFLAGNGTTGGEVRTTFPDHLLALHLPHVQRTRVVDDWPWMLRLVDVGVALAARGYPRIVSGSLRLEVSDPFADGPVSGVFEVADGAGSWSPGGTGGARVRVQDLAAVYAGADPRVLASAGRLDGATERDLDLLRTVFTAVPTAVDFF